MKKYFFFDLDGTLCNTGEGVINGFAFALSKLGITVEDKSALRKIMGPPIDYSFRNFYGLNDSQIQEGVKIYREYYNKTGVFEFKPYDEVEELLINLKRNSKKLFVATSKPIFFAKKVLEKCGFDKYFDGIYGSEFDGTRAKKARTFSKKRVFSIPFTSFLSFFAFASDQTKSFKNQTSLSSMAKDLPRR